MTQLQRVRWMLLPPPHRRKLAFYAHVASITLGEAIDELVDEHCGDLSSWLRTTMRALPIEKRGQVIAHTEMERIAEELRRR